VCVFDNVCMCVCVCVCVCECVSESIKTGHLIDRKCIPVKHIC